MSELRFLSFCSALALAASAAAQFPCIVQDGHAAYTFNGPGTTCSTPGGTSNFAANAIDQLYQHWWYLSIDGAGPACTLNDLPIGNITANCTGLGGRKATLRNLSGVAPYTLADANNMNPSPGDHASAFQWDAVLAPGARTTAYVSVGIDREPPCQQPANATTYCLSKPGTNGHPDWELAAQPLAATSMPFTITQGLAGLALTLGSF